MKFEERVKRLEAIAQKMSDEDTTLDESLELYAEGVEQTKECLALLNENKEKMKQLSMQMDALFNGETDAI